MLPSGSEPSYNLTTTRPDNVTPYTCSRSTPLQLADLAAARDNLLDCRDSLRKAAAEFHEEAAHSMHPAIEAIARQIGELDVRIVDLLHSDPGLARRSQIIQSVPGCGHVIAAVLCAELSELGTIGHPQAACLVGVAPFDCNSGQCQGRRGLRSAPATRLEMACRARGPSRGAARIAKTHT